ncbi:MAG: HEAT repeat domain-containing protein [Candidatus Latescibacterota bacterium]
MDKKLATATPEAASGISDDDLISLPRVEQVLKSLVKLIHGRKLYAENNPRLSEFAREFDVSLRGFFRKEDALVLGVEQNAITWNGEVVYENEKREESIAFFLRRDGIGEITIHKKAVGEETNLLVQILTEEYHNLTSDEDVVTKFWNADFEYISYRVLDDYLSVEYAEARPGEKEEPDTGTIDHPEMLPSLRDKGRVIVQRSDPLESIDDYLKKLIMRTCPSSEKAEQEAYFQSMLGSFFTISNEEINIYQEQLREESRHDSLATFMDAVLVFTLLLDNPSAVRDVSGVVERIVEYAVEDIDPHTLWRIITLVRDFKEQSLPESVEKFCDGIIAKVSEDSVIQSLGERLKFWNKDSEDILGYFTAVGPPVADPLLMVLHNVEGEKLHKEISDVLISVSGGDIAALIEKLDIDKSEVAFDAVYIANKVGMNEMTPKLKELLFYPDPNVKEEMLKLVARVDDPSSVDLLLRAIKDEHKQIRLRAIEAVTSKDDPRVLERLTELAFGKQLSEYESDEQEALFAALGKTGNAATVEALKKFIDKKTLVYFGNNSEKKILAIRALEGIKSPASLNLLKKLSEDSNDVVKTRAGRTYGALQKTMREERAKRAAEADEE